MDVYKGKYGRMTKYGLSMYFDKSIPDWLKSKRKLRRKVKRRFIEEMKLELTKSLQEEERKFLYGDLSAGMPVGILNCKELTQKEK